MLKNDPAFGLISRVAKKKKIVATSNCWMQLASTAAKSNPFQTEWLGQQDHRDWAKFLGATWGRLPKKWFDENGDRVLISKAAWFSYGSSKERGADGSYQVVDHPNQVWLKFSLKRKDPWVKIDLNRVVRNVGKISDPKFDLYHAPLRLDAKKVSDLHKMAAWLPRKFRSNYRVPDEHEGESSDLDFTVDSHKPRNNTSDEDEGEFPDLDMTEFLSDEEPEQAKPKKKKFNKDKGRKEKQKELPPNSHSPRTSESLGAWMERVLVWGDMMVFSNPQSPASIVVAEAVSLEEAEEEGCVPVQFYGYCTLSIRFIVRVVVLSFVHELSRSTTAAPTTKGGLWRRGPFFPDTSILRTRRLSTRPDPSATGLPMWLGPLFKTWCMQASIWKTRNFPQTPFELFAHDDELA